MFRIRNLPKFSLFRRGFFSAQLLCCNLQFWCPNWSYFLPVFLGCPRLPMTRLHLGGAKFSQVSELLRRCCVHVCYEAWYSVIAVFACIRGASGCKAQTQQHPGTAWVICSRRMSSCWLSASLVCRRTASLRSMQHAV